MFSQKKFAIKHKKELKIIYDNKIYDLKSTLPLGDHYDRIRKIKLLLLSDNLYFIELLSNIKLSLEYIINDDNIFPPSIVHKFPKHIYNTKVEDDDGNGIKLIDGSFLGTNLGKIILILYENIIFPIEEYFPDQCMDEYEEKLEIFLIMLQKPDNLNEMFYKCSQLEEISINEKDNSIVQEDKQKDLINPLASPSAGAPALNYGDVNTVTPSPSEVKWLIILICFFMNHIYLNFKE